VTIRAGFFTRTYSFDVTDEASNFTVTGTNESKHAYIVQSDVTIHLTRDGTAASASNGLRIPANTHILINTVAGDVISFIRGADEEDDGTIWFTEVDH
jgi:hypothetical protein